MGQQHHIRNRLNSSPGSVQRWQTLPTGTPKAPLKVFLQIKRAWYNILIGKLALFSQTFDEKKKKRYQYHVCTIYVKFLFNISMKTAYQLLQTSFTNSYFLVASYLLDKHESDIFSSNTPQEVKLFL